MGKSSSRIGCLIALLVLCGCNSTDDIFDNCERVTSGESDVVIQNQLGTGVEAFFEDIAFSALIQPGKCETFGMPSGSREVELTQCNFVADDTCDPFGQTVSIDLPLAVGEERRIDVTASLF